MSCWLEENCKKLHCNDVNGCMIKFKLDYLYKEALISEKQRKKVTLCLDDTHADESVYIKLKGIQDDIVNKVNNGMQLYIHSNIAGNGKTSWSLRLLQTYFNKIWLKTPLTCRGLFINVPNLLLELKENITNKSTYIEHIRKYIDTADIVIWDDIGSKAATQFEAENLLSMIERRINTGKANIFTSNLNDAELHQALGDRLASRICHLGYNFEFKEGDKRGLI